MGKIKKILITISLIICSLYIYTFSVMAAPQENSGKQEDGTYQKALAISLVSDYESATFSFVFEDEQAHHIEITTPDDKKIEKDSESLQVLVDVDNAAAGKYSIIITAKDEISVSSSVECFNAPVSVNPDDVSVSTVLSGLKMYFADGDFCATWDDIDKGSIYVSIYSPATMELLLEDKVDGTEYRTKIPEGIDEIKVYFVLSSEREIDGAGTTYTIPVVRDIKGSITPPEITVTNDIVVPVNISIEEKMTVYAINNDEEVFREKYEAGDYTIEIPIDGINNAVKVVLVDEKDNQKSISFDILRDLVGPKLVLTDGGTDVVVTEKEYIIQGFVNDANRVYINNNEISFSETGEFSFNIDLSEGTNEIIVCATDEAGNENVISYTVDYQLSGGSLKGRILLFGVVGIILILLIAVVIKKIKDAGKKSENAKNAPKESAEKEEIKKFISRRKYRDFLYFLPMLLFCIALILTLSLWIRPTYSPTSSMEPTVKAGDLALVDRLAYKNSSPQRGDIIIFDYSKTGAKDAEARLGKRVIGIAGDEIYFLNGDVYINGCLVEEEYIGEGIETNCTKEFKVPEHCVFVMGDNRENSYDSRFLAEPYIDESYIYGKYIGNCTIPFLSDLLKEN